MARVRLVPDRSELGEGSTYLWLCETNLGTLNCLFHAYLDYKTLFTLAQARLGSLSVKEYIDRKKL